jgi:hypothetical protein
MDRPFLHVHPTASEREVQVINLTKATVVPSPDVELLLGVSLGPPEIKSRLISRNVLRLQSSPVPIRMFCKRDRPRR